MNRVLRSAFKKTATVTPQASDTPRSATASLSQRKAIAEDTIARMKGVIKQHAREGATSSSTFIRDQLEPLDPSKSPNAPSSLIEVINSDAFTIARRLISEVPEAKGNTAVLNLASDEHPAGGWLFSLSKTQEEALCYASTLYSTLKKSYYPWPNVGPGSVAGVYSPGVVIFKHDLDNNCRELEQGERQVVSVLTVAAPRYRPLSPDRRSFQEPSTLEDLKGKIRLVYRMAAHNGQQYLVLGKQYNPVVTCGGKLKAYCVRLGAMGCGAYACPPRLVADQMKSILLEPEFQGWFQKIIFAVYDKDGLGSAAYPTNFAIFSDVFRDVKTSGPDQ
ncbi:hypothetical protein EST38_g1493 [Candolleomyces aberdarensis]|uniref:Microbial-type PARG catalytic domain-containing protein n=1 Tax=Candolleomyces aberdarensis TaxID=2316362 RepID=A0A4Q2DVZ7_9AGAR|nr:hypothetical protein EST38_g1493 [Candolleomyces aberdarensis]